MIPFFIIIKRGTIMDIKTLQERVNGAIAKGYDLYKIDDRGWLIGDDFITEGIEWGHTLVDYTKSRSNIKLVQTVQPINAIIEHSTAGSSLYGSLNTGRGDKIPGTHFYVNKLGKIFQAVPLTERTSHITNTTNRTSMLQVTTSSSIGIENVRMWYANKGWDIVTPEQIATNVKLVNTLLVAYGLNKNQVLAHEDIQRKTTGEGKEIVDAIYKYLI